MDAMEKKKKTLERILAQKLQDACSPRLKGKGIFNPKRLGLFEVRQMKIIFDFV